MPVVDAVVRRPEVDPKRIALIGVSQGGYWVPRALAFERRIAAGVADPGIWDVSEPFLRNFPQFLLDMLWAHRRPFVLHKSLPGSFQLARNLLRFREGLQNPLPCPEQPHLQRVLVHVIDALQLSQREPFHFFEDQQRPVLLRHVRQEGLNEFAQPRPLILIRLHLAAGLRIRRQHLLLGQIRHPRLDPPSLPPKIIVRRVDGQTVQPRLEHLRRSQLVQG